MRSARALVAGTLLVLAMATLAASADARFDGAAAFRHLERLVHEEVDVMMDRVAGEMDSGEAADLLERAVEPMRDLVAAMRAKLMIAELQQRRAAQRS